MRSTEEPKPKPNNTASKPPVPWSEGTGASGMYCSRILEQRKTGKTRMLLPLSVIPEEVPPEAGQRMLILTAPVRGMPFTIAKVEFCSLGELTDYHFQEMEMGKAPYLSKWDECNPKRPAEGNPDIMLLWLIPAR